MMLRGSTTVLVNDNGDGTVSPRINIPRGTLAQLGSASRYPDGFRAVQTDAAKATSFNEVAVGGGSATVPVWNNAGTWYYG